MNKDSYLNTVTLDRGDINSLKETLHYGLDIPFEEEISDTDVYKYWIKFPFENKSELIEWGASDTLARENLWSWLQNNKSIKNLVD